MKDTPLISVIVPIYNVEKYLVRCIESIQNQTYKKLEIILVDDGSPDDCGDICDQYAKDDNRIVVIHKKNSGLSDARNIGIETATGDYISFVDSDDYLDLKMFETLYYRMQKDHSDMAICNFTYVDEFGINIDEKNSNMPIENGKFLPQKILEQLSNNQYWYYVTAWNKLYRRTLFDKIKFPVGKIHEDEFIIHHIINQCNLISCIRKSMYYYVQHTNSIMTSKFSYKNLDGAEAFFDRAIFAIRYELINMAIISLKRGMIIVLKSYDILEKDEMVFKRKRELKKMYNQIYFQLMLKKIGIKNQMAFFLFFLNPFIYKKLLRITAKLN